MVHKKNQKQITEKQEGITLLLSIMVLASIIAIVLSFGSIALNEVKTSGELVKTEPALTSAEAGAELGLFQSIRGIGGISTNCNSPTISTFSNGASLSSCENYYLPNPNNLNLLSGAEQDYYIYNPTNQSQNSAPGYQSVSIYMNSGSSATIDLCTWNDANCTGAPDVSSAVINNGGTWSSALNSSSKYQLIILNSSQPASFIINDTNSNNNVGLPSGTTLIQTSGSNGDVTRKIETNLPQ